MNCLDLAQKLAAKANNKQTTVPMSPSLSHSCSRIASRTENIPQQTTDNQKPKVVKFALQPTKCHAYVPPFNRCFNDVNLRRYFERFLKERHLYSVVEFISEVENFKEHYPSTVKKQRQAHVDLIGKLGTLPSDYVNATHDASNEMSLLSVTSFDHCTALIMEELERREFHPFLDSPHYAKWVMKYHNVGNDN